VLVINVTPFLDGYHPDSIPAALDHPMSSPRRRELSLSSLDDYVAVLERILSEREGRREASA